MKKLCIKALCLILTAMLLASNVSVLASDVAGDVVIADNAATFTGYYFANYKSGDINSNIEPRNMYDVVADEVVRQFATEAFYTNNSRGSEPRFFLVDTKSTKDNPVALGEGKVDFAKYDYLRIAFDIYIGDENDGMGFRMQRFNSDGVVDTTNDYYIGVGGSSYTAGSVSNGYRIVNSTLEAGKWNSVVMELGSTKSDIRFYINNELSTKTSIRKSGSTTELAGFPEGTYGFGGYSNTCVMVLKGERTTDTNGVQPFDIRLHDFSMIATNSEYSVPSDAVLMNQLVYELTASSNLVKKKNSIENTEIAAPHIPDKMAIHHSVSDFVAASTAGNESGYNTLTSKVGGFVGGLDYTKYDNLRLQFNMYLNDASNGIYFRARRSADKTSFENDHYVFGMGGATFKRGSSGTTTAQSYSYTGLETGKWYNVVMEFGANPGNRDVKFYVNGELVLNKENDLKDGVYGYGGANTNWAIIAINAATGGNLDFYLSDLKLIASNTRHNPENVFVPYVEGVNSTVGVADDKIYSYSPITADKLTPVRCDKLALLDLNEDSTNETVVVYNDSSKAVRYYNNVNTTGLYMGNDEFVVDENGAASLAADIFNLTGETKNARAVIAYYNNDEELVSVEYNGVDSITPEIMSASVNVDAVAPEAEYKTIRAFLWTDFDELYPITQEYKFVK